MIPLRDDNPSSSAPVVTVLLILACLAIFVYVSYGLGSEAAAALVLQTYGFIPAELSAPGGLAVEAPALVTSMFLHGGWFHVIGNMWFLRIFGDNVEDRMGHVGFLVFYLLAGVIAALTHAWFNPASANPLIGASGAIAGVLGAYTVLFPRARIRSLAVLGFFVTTMRIPAFVFLPFWFLLQFVSGLESLRGAGGGIAWWAHVGGFIAGIALVPIFARRRPPRIEW